MLSLTPTITKFIKRSCNFFATFLKTLYKTMIRTIFDYGDVLYDSCLKSESDSLEKFQRKAALICTRLSELLVTKDY